MAPDILGNLGKCGRGGPAALTTHPCTRIQAGVPWDVHQRSARSKGFQSFWSSSYLKQSLQGMLMQHSWPTQEDILSSNCFQQHCKVLSAEGGITTLQSFPHSQGCRSLFLDIKWELTSQPEKMLGCHWICRLRKCSQSWAISWNSTLPTENFLSLHEPEK